jgi:two-component system, chemotaxis family, sensor kinase CheA
VPDLLKSARRAGAAPPMPDSSGSASTQAQASGRRILIAEDSITSRMLLKGILESAGYQVSIAVDGIDAFTTLRSGHFDLVVSDVEMPRLSGFDLTARIRADRDLAEIPVVLVTALESREDRERGIEVGANAYLVKSSLDQDDLLEALRRLL